MPTRHQSAKLLSIEEQIRRFSASELKRIKEIEAEHSKLKRMYADLAMENEALKELFEKSPGASRTPLSGRLARPRAFDSRGACLPCRGSGTFELVL